MRITILKQTQYSIITQIILAIMMTSCNHNIKSLDDYIAHKTINLSETTDTSYFDFIESLSVVNLEVDSDWVYFSYPLLIANEWGTVCIDQDVYKMLTFGPDGKKIASRFLEGRGPGECITIGNIFQMEDSICIYDQAMGKINVYNFQGKFLGVLNKNTLVVADEVYPLSDGMFAGVSFYPSSTDSFPSTEQKTERKVEYVTLYDNQFKQRSHYLTLPSFYAYTSMQIGNTTSVFTYKDSLRFILPFDHHFFSFTEDSLECQYDFVSKNAIPSEVLNRNGLDVMSTDFLIELQKNSWAKMCSNLAETSRFISFTYYVGGVTYKVLIDKTNDKEVSITVPVSLFYSNGPEVITTTQLWGQVIHAATTTLYSDEDYLYASMSCSLFWTLKKYESSQDDRLRDLYNQMKTYVEGNKLYETDRFLVRIKLIK